MMQNEDQYMERTPDLVARIQKLREAAEKEMNRFTRVADYDVRRVVGHGPKTSSVSDETAPHSSAMARPKRSIAASSTDQTSIEFAPAPAEPDDSREGE